MKYRETITLKDGRQALLRNADASDGQAVFEVFNLTHAETDYLLSYPEENSFTAEEEADFLQKKADSDNEIEIVAEVDGTVVGTAGIEAFGGKYKVRHRADFGISVLRDYWGLGVGRALTLACIRCARDAGFTQLELNAVADNGRAIALYKSVGFEEYGRNPRGFNSKLTGYQPLLYMRLEL